MSAAPSSSDEKATIVSPGPKKGFFSKKDKVQEKGADERDGSESSTTASGRNPRAPLVDTSESTAGGIDPVLPPAIAAPSVSKPDSGTLLQSTNNLLKKERL